MKAYDFVYTLLKNKPEARLLKNRNRVIWAFWEHEHGIGEDITKEEFLTLTPPETITRAIRAVIEDNQEWRDPTSDAKETEVRSDVKNREREKPIVNNRSGLKPSEIAKKAFNERTQQ